MQRLQAFKLQLPIVSRPRLPATTNYRAFGTGAMRLASKESALNTDTRADEAEFMKKEQLEKQKKGKNEWVDGLASDSESSVRADRDEHDHHAETEKMQREAEKAAKQQK